MRLNRVLQTTAAIGIAMAATIFTISCGEDGTSGADGASCTLRSTATGYDVECGGAKVGELASGGVGEQGQAGPVGPNGQPGTGCVVGEKTSQGYQILCGGQPRGYLDGCSVTENIEEQSKTIVCGSSSVGMCGSGVNPTIFDPELEKCISGTPTPIKLTCAGTDATGAELEYEPKTEYCRFKDADSLAAGVVGVGTYCGKDGKPNDETQTEWKGEYCKVVREYDSEKGTPVYSLKVAEPTDCDGTSVELDKATATTSPYGFKGEYCGYDSPTALKKILINNTAAPSACPTEPCVCGDGKGPHEEAWQAGYCQMTSPDSKATVFSTDFCAGDRATPATYNEGEWKAEYCGYANAAAATQGSVVLTVQTAKIGGYDYSVGSSPYGVTTGMFSTTVSKNVAIAKRLTDNCALMHINSEINSGAPYPTTTNPDYTNSDATRLFEFCSVNVDDKGEFFVEASSIQAAVDNNGCPGPASYAPNKSPTIELNKNGWLKEYCGFSSSNVDPGKLTSGKLFIPSTCGFLKPNTQAVGSNAEMEYCQADSTGALKLATPQDNECTAKLNEGTWQNQYCGYNSTSASAKKVVVKAPNARCALLAPNQSKPADASQMEYCTVDKEGVMSLTTPSENDCAANNAKLNEGKWTGEYCGYATATATVKTVIKEFVAAKGGVSCNELQPNKEQPADPLSFEYCQADKEGKLTLVKVSDDVCNAKAADRINEGTWKGEYCVGNFKVTCAGGLIANPDYDGSTGAAAPPKCIWPPEAAKRLPL